MWHKILPSTLSVCAMPAKKPHQLVSRDLIDSTSDLPQHTMGPNTTCTITLPLSTARSSSRSYSCTSLKWTPAIVAVRTPWSWSMHRPSSAVIHSASDVSNGTSTVLRRQETNHITLTPKRSSQGTSQDTSLVSSLMASRSLQLEGGGVMLQLWWLQMIPGGSLGLSWVTSWHGPTPVDVVLPKGITRHPTVPAWPGSKPAPSTCGCGLQTNPQAPGRFTICQFRDDLIHEGHAFVLKCSLMV